MKLLIAFAAALFLASCATSSIAPPAPKGTVDHVVLFWLKRPGNAEDRQALLAATEELRAIPGIRSLNAGTVLKSDRPVVDDSFDTSLVVQFDTVESLHAYEVNPLHVKKVNEVLKPLSRKILVYDTVR